jgi:hypothetical protein
VSTAGETVVWAAALGSECAAWAALVARPLTRPGGARKRQGEAGKTAASVLTAFDLEGKEGAALWAKRSTISFLEEAIHAPCALTGDPRAKCTLPSRVLLARSRRPATLSIAVPNVSSTRTACRAPLLLLAEGITLALEEFEIASESWRQTPAFARCEYAQLFRAP